MLLIYFFQFLLSAHLAEAHEDCGNLCGVVILRVQLAVGAVDNAVGNRPPHCTPLHSCLRLQRQRSCRANRLAGEPA